MVEITIASTDRHLEEILALQLRISVGQDYDLCVTEIATRNRVSVRAHARVGFETLSTYRDPHEERFLVASDLSHPELCVRACVSASQPRPRQPQTEVCFPAVTSMGPITTYRRYLNLFVASLRQGAVVQSSC
jgi:hypothetical protein